MAGEAWDLSMPVRTQYAIAVKRVCRAGGIKSKRIKAKYELPIVRYAVADPIEEDTSKRLKLQRSENCHDRCRYLMRSKAIPDDAQGQKIM